MIIQQVNLYQENLKPKQLNADNFLYLSVAVVFILILIGFSGYFQNKLHNSQQATEQIEQKLNNQKTLVKQLENRLPKQQTDSALLTETQQWQKKITDLTQTLDLLENKSKMQNQGFSSYFLALANGSVSGIWLSMINFDARQELINFEGSTFSADDVPFFLQHLQQQPVFHGRSFAHLAIKQSTITPQLMNFKLSTHLPALKKSHVE